MKIKETGVFNDDGTRAMSIPFQVWSVLGGWKPICVQHKVMFMRPRSYGSHWTPLCEDVAPNDYPVSDYAFRLQGYKKIWL